MLTNYNPAPPNPPYKDSVSQWGGVCVRDSFTRWVTESSNVELTCWESPFTVLSRPSDQGAPAGNLANLSNSGKPADCTFGLQRSFCFPPFTLAHTAAWSLGSSALACNELNAVPHGKPGDCAFGDHFYSLL